MDARTWLLLCLLLIGILASVVGYVGCFSVVQNSTSPFGPVSWLCLEAGLSLMRLGIWAWNPTSDDAPPLEITLELDEHKPLPTCNKDDEEILENKVLPLTRARDFLKIITSFAGLIDPFNNPDLSLYYTLTRKRPSEESASLDTESVSVDIGDYYENRVNEIENAEKHILGEQTLYITVFDHKERTTRVYTRENEIDIIYSTKSDAVDVGHFLLEVEIDAKIDAKGDPVSNGNNLDSLRKHHRSILEHIQYRLGAADVTNPYTVENSWTMKVEDTVSTLQRLKAENGDNWKMVVENEKEEERNEESLLICDYFTYASIERERRLLDEKRVKWIACRMEMITKETKERFQGETEVEYRVNKQALEKKPATKSPGEIEWLLLREQYVMELLLASEVNEWERLFWNKFKAFLDQFGNDRVGEKERLTREWGADCWKRLNPQMHAAQKRVENNKVWVRTLGDRWASSISQLIEGVDIPSPTLLSKLRGEIEHLNAVGALNNEIRLRMEKEIEDTEFRLKRGSDLGRFDQFWDDDTLFKCRYSRSKWLNLSLLGPPLEIYLHALKQNKNFVHIIFSPDSDINQLLANLPRVTSISGDSFGRLPAIQSDLMFIKSTNNDLITFAKEIRLKMPVDNFSTYIFTDAGTYDILSDKLRHSARILISFVAPASDQSLILRLKHSGEQDGPLEVTLGSTIIQLNPLSKSSLTIDDITLYPIQVPGPSAPDHLSFVPEIRNDIVIQFVAKNGQWHGHFLHDVELLDEAGGPWRVREI